MITCILAAEFQYLGGKYCHYNTYAEYFFESLVNEEHNMRSKLQKKKTFAVANT
jgi:hypothetical protein